MMRRPLHGREGGRVWEWWIYEDASSVLTHVRCSWSIEYIQSGGMSAPTAHEGARMPRLLIHAEDRSRVAPERNGSLRGGDGA